jgi:hydroxymethylglutaryl-CoA lyase
VKAALDLGIRRFDGSAGGLGGCPYASTPTKRAPGNIATETLVDVVHAAGFKTGVDVTRLRAAGEFAKTLIRCTPQGAPA